MIDINQFLGMRHAVKNAPEHEMSQETRKRKHLFEKQDTYPFLNREMKEEKKSPKRREQRAREGRANAKITKNVRSYKQQNLPYDSETLGKLVADPL